MDLRQRGSATTMTPIHIMFIGVIAAVAAILLGALTDMSIGVIGIFVLAGAMYFAFLRGGEQKTDDS